MSKGTENKPIFENETPASKDVNRESEWKVAPGFENLSSANKCTSLECIKHLISEFEGCMVMMENTVTRRYNFTASKFNFNYLKALHWEALCDGMCGHIDSPF